MILYPAIDLKDGNVVRLERGEMAKATQFSDDPAAQARAFAEAGITWLHVVDLNGAFEGKPVNADAVESILKALPAGVQVQLGGGIRDLATIEDWLSRGVARVILGTIALQNPDIVKEACEKFPGRIAVGIDAKGGRVAIQGWAEVSETAALTLAQRFKDVGICAIIYTDIDRDGLKKGVNAFGAAQLGRNVKIPVIASGGVSGIPDLLALKASGPYIHGAIIGRALYDGGLDLKAALAAVG